MNPHSPELHRQVGAVLFREWDPIGVNAHAPADEYDFYAAGLIRLIQDGADVRQVATRLGVLARVSLGLSHEDSGRDHAVARRLIEVIRGDVL